MKKELTAERLRELLSYDPETGVFTWKVNRSKSKAGRPTGYVYKDGPVTISVEGYPRLAHRLAWLYMTGKCASHDVTHTNGDKTDNRFKNLAPPTAARKVRELTQESLKEVISYDAETGNFSWRAKRLQKKLGPIAGHLDKKGYWTVRVYRKLHLAHRLAWLYVTGSWPAQQLDHINNNPSDNRFANLRDVSQFINQQNRPKSKGYSLHRNGKYYAQIIANGAHISLGGHATPAEAHSAYIKGKQQHHAGYVQ